MYHILKLLTFFLLIVQTVSRTIGILPTLPSPTVYNDDNCPVCMKPDLSRLDCMLDVSRTEKCVDEDSCYVFSLTEPITVTIKEGLQIEMSKIVKCFQDNLLQTGEGCKHDKCTGDLYRADEEITVFSTGISTRGPLVVEFQTSEYFTTEGREALTHRPTDGEMSTVQPTLEGGSDKSDQAVTLELEPRSVCSEQIQDCPAGEKCFGRKMGDGTVQYTCSQETVECSGDDGCIATCMPPYLPCEILPTSPTPSLEPPVTEESKPKPVTYKVSETESASNPDVNFATSLTGSGFLLITALSVMLS